MRQSEHEGSTSATEERGDQAMEEENEMRDTYRVFMKPESPLNLLDQMSLTDMCLVNDTGCLGVLPDYKRQRQVPFKRKMRIRIVNGTSNDPENRVTLMFLNPLLHIGADG
ncbi:hypothetical protein CYMTET_45836 [Cymbomonas tetramitiformis]|uniref:Uncharacterized protein n=1 Tax=Cymbomonas tetramitiformis TaxID=36881 RepID=A0AAE0BXE9_9CHLO|nr:hypothetical protein CYMTET_45836 [Cymbomonas tetramitiformis]